MVLCTAVVNMDSHRFVVCACFGGACVLVLTRARQRRAAAPPPAGTRRISAQDTADEAAIQCKGRAPNGTSQHWTEGGEPLERQQEQQEQKQARRADTASRRVEVCGWRYALPREVRRITHLKDRFAGERVVHVDCAEHAIAVTSSGSLHTWGRSQGGNMYGGGTRLGHGHPAGDQYSPKLVQALVGVRIG